MADLMGASLPATTLQDKEDTSYYVTPKLQMAADRSIQLQKVSEDSTHSDHVAALTNRSYDGGSLSIVYDMWENVNNIFVFNFDFFFVKFNLLHVGLFTKLCTSVS